MQGLFIYFLGCGDVKKTTTVKDALYSVIALLKSPLLVHLPPMISVVGASSCHLPVNSLSLWRNPDARHGPSFPLIVLAVTGEEITAFMARTVTRLPLVLSQINTGTPQLLDLFFRNWSDYYWNWKKDGQSLIFIIRMRLLVNMYTKYMNIQEHPMFKILSNFLPHFFSSIFSTTSWKV